MKAAAIARYPASGRVDRLNKRCNRWRMRVRGVAVLASAALASVVCIAAASAFEGPAAASASSHRFTATYVGHGSGQAAGGSAAGTATATGRGRLIGASTFTGSARGSYSGQCFALRGTAILKGRPGSLKLAVNDVHACAANADAVSFSGSAKVKRGTSTFAGARGKLFFSGKYVAERGALTISFRGRITY